jgi:hypothetical protein
MLELPVEHDAVRAGEQGAPQAAVSGVVGQRGDHGRPAGGAGGRADRLGARGGVTAEHQQQDGCIPGRDDVDLRVAQERCDPGSGRRVARDE